VIWTQPAGDTSTDPNLVGWWKLDEGSGVTAYDSSGHGNNGILCGSPQWVAGRIDSALHFDGVDDGVDCPNSASLDVTGPITLAAWVKTEDSGDRKTHEYIVKGHRAYALRHQQDNVIEFMIFDGLSFLQRPVSCEQLFQRGLAPPDRCVRWGPGRIVCRRPTASFFKSCGFVACRIDRQQHRPCRYWMQHGRSKSSFHRGSR
jgi:hypothetical protein